MRLRTQAFYANKRKNSRQGAVATGRSTAATRYAVSACAMGPRPQGSGLAAFPPSPLSPADGEDHRFGLKLLTFRQREMHARTTGSLAIDPAAAVYRQLLFVHVALTQSLSLTQDRGKAHFGQTLPPQSTSVSSKFLIMSEQWFASGDGVLAHRAPTSG